MKHVWQRTEGYLKAEIIGDEPEKFIHLCVQEHITIWHIVRKNRTTLVGYIGITDSNRLKTLLERCGCRIHILQKSGMPFFLEKLKLRLGIAAGALFFIFLLLLLSNMVWSVRVEGADSGLETQIRTLLRHEHLYEGAIDLFVPDSGRLENTLVKKLSKVTWIGVSKEGTTYKISVVQKKYPKPKLDTGPRNLVAGKQAIIRRMFVETGQPVVESDQFVKPGQLLVSGTIGNEKSSKKVSAKGKVIGETWYRSDVRIPVNGRYTMYSGATIHRHILKIGNWSVPVWGFHKRAFVHYDREVTRKPIRFLFWTTPFTYIQETDRQKKTVERRLTLKEALDEAVQSANRKLLDRLPQGATIVSSTVDHKKTMKGYLYLRLHQVVNENIAVARPIHEQNENDGRADQAK